MPAEATPRQFEIAKCALDLNFGSNSELADHIYRYNQRMIRENKQSAFRVFRDEEFTPIGAPTIASYISFSRKIGILDENLNPINGIIKSTKLGPFSTLLRQITMGYCKSKRIWIDDISRFIKNEIESGRMNGKHIRIPTKDHVRNSINAQISGFDFNQSMKLLSELFPSQIFYGSQNVILERNSLWLQ